MTATAERTHRLHLGTVQDVRITHTPRNPYAAGYGPKIPTGSMVRVQNRWRRVYVMCYGNAGSSYILIEGVTFFLDSEVEEFLLAAALEAREEDARRGH